MKMSEYIERLKAMENLEREDEALFTIPEAGLYRGKTEERDSF